jgi:hypothetical protein
LLQVTDPAGRCRKWALRIWQYTRGTPREQNEAFNEVRNATNYKGKIRARSDFDPFAFSLEGTRTAVRDALASKGSVRTGPKMTNYPLRPEALGDPGLLSGYAKPKRGQAYERRFEEGTASFQSEVTNTERRDRLSRALCAYCGNPNDLKACSACRKVWYCGREHQRYARALSSQCSFSFERRADWKVHKQECKSK